MTQKDFTTIVTNKREALDLTQIEFAKKIGVSWFTVLRWEHGRMMPKPDALRFWVERIKNV